MYRFIIVILEKCVGLNVKVWFCNQYKIVMRNVVKTKIVIYQFNGGKKDVSKT